MSREVQLELKGDPKIDNSKVNDGNIRKVGT